MIIYDILLFLIIYSIKGYENSFNTILTRFYSIYLKSDAFVKQFNDMHGDEENEDHNSVFVGENNFNFSLKFSMKMVRLLSAMNTAKYFILEFLFILKAFQNHFLI